MDIPELPDYVIYCLSMDFFMYWGSKDGTLQWQGVRHDAHATLFTIKDAEHHLKELRKKGWDYSFEIRPRIKSGITLTKI